MIFMNIPYAGYVIPNNRIGQYQVLENMQTDSEAAEPGSFANV